MLSITKTTNLSGTSVINGQSAMTMYAAIPETGSLTISQTITNKELYLANQTQQQQHKISKSVGLSLRSYF